MEPLDEFDPEPSPPRGADGDRPLWPYLLSLAVILAAVVVYFVWFRAAPPAAVPAQPAAAPAVEQPPVMAPEPLPPPPPPLDGSDDWVRRAVAELSSHPALVSWLVSENLARRFTAAVDNVAAGDSPRPHLGFLDPGGRFEVSEQDGEESIDPASFARFDRFAQAIDSLDEAGTVQLYRRSEPLIRQAYADLGYPDGGFDATLRRALRHLLAVRLPESPIAVEAGVESYQFEDPRLESLSAAQKHLLRMGPANARLVQAKLRAILQRLDGGGG